MKTRKVLSYKQRGTKPPYIGTAFIFLALDQYNAPSWLWGASATIITLLWIALIVDVFQQEQVEIEELKTREK